MSLFVIYYSLFNILTFKVIYSASLRLPIWAFTPVNILFINTLYIINYYFRCCQVCARTFGEACGGPGGFSGTCEPPLQCVSKPPVIGSGICLGK